MSCFDQSDAYLHRFGQLLNTFSNLGGTWPKFFVLKGVDFFSVAICELSGAGGDISIKGMERIVFYRGHN